MTKFNCEYRKQSEEYPVNPWKIADFMLILWMNQQHPKKKMEKQEYIDAIKAKIAQLNELVAAAEKATGEEEMVKVAEKIGEVGTDIFAHSDGFLQL